PPLVLADEPTAHLDYIQVDGVLRLLRQIADDGRLVVVATRPPETVSLDNGEVLFEQGDTGRDRGSPGRRAKARALRRTEFGTPHAAARLPVGRWSAGRPDPRLNVDARWPLHSQSDGGTIGRSGIASPTGVRSLTVPVDPGERVGRPTAASR